MIFSKSLWIVITLDGIDGAICSALIPNPENNAFLTVFGPERVTGDYSSMYNPLSPEGLPKPEDQSNFATLYRKLESLVNSGKIDGPYVEDHPAMYMRFQYIKAEISPTEMLSFLEKQGIKIVVKKVTHRGNNAEVEQAKKDFSKWIDKDTIFDQHPEFEEKQEIKEWKKSMAGAEKADKKIQRSIMFPILTLLLGLLLYGAFSINWLVGTAFAAFLGFVWWWIRH